MNQATNTQLIPLREMIPGDAARIRNSVINQLVALASKELSMPETDLVVRDILPYTDLGWDWAAATNSTTESWTHDASGDAVGYHTFTGDTTMSDQRYVAIFGVRDCRYGLAATNTATEIVFVRPAFPISLLKFSVGGASKAIWDTSGLCCYVGNAVAFSPAAIILPQNVSFNIYYYSKNYDSSSTVQKDVDMKIQLLGVTVEPRGKVISP